MVLIGETALNIYTALGRPASAPLTHKAIRLQGLPLPHAMVGEVKAIHVFRSKRYAIRERPSSLEQKHSSKVVHQEAHSAAFLRAACEGLLLSAREKCEKCEWAPRGEGRAWILTGAGRCYGSVPIGVEPIPLNVVGNNFARCPSSTERSVATSVSHIE